MARQNIGVPELFFERDRFVLTMPGEQADMVSYVRYKAMRHAERLHRVLAVPDLPTSSIIEEARDYLERYVDGPEAGFNLGAAYRRHLALRKGQVV